MGTDSAEDRLIVVAGVAIGFADAIVGKALFAAMLIVVLAYALQKESPVRAWVWIAAFGISGTLAFVFLALQGGPK